LYFNLYFQRSVTFVLPASAWSGSSMYRGRLGNFGETRDGVGKSGMLEH